MWYQNVEKNTYFEQLYNSIPKLEDVTIFEIKMNDSGGRANIKIKMPFYADNPPPKWSVRNYNAVVLELCFNAIESIKIDTSSRRFKGKIDVWKDARGYVNFQINGTIKLDIVAEVCSIGDIKGYLTHTIN